MENNLTVIEHVLDYIELHLMDEGLNLETISEESGYSRYHLHRMFTSVVGFPVHNYIQRRRLTEAARMLIFTEKPLIEIAILSGYDTQRSFSKAFKSMFRHTPGYFRKQKDFMPLQLKFDIRNRKKRRGDRILNIEKVQSPEIKIVGYSANTDKGFSVIGKCWKNLHKSKNAIINKADPDFLIGVNDYSEYMQNDDTAAFTYFAGAQVFDFGMLPKGMKKIILPESSYVVFYFTGKNEDSMQDIVEYIYQEWFPNSSCEFDHKKLYDFVKYGEKMDECGNSDIQFWVPIC